MATDLPVDPCPTGLYDDRKELWYCCTGIVNFHETGDDLKQMALGIRQQLRLEARVNELTELFYAVKAERDKLAAFKAYVHQRLDAAGVPADPDSSHKAEGCRIGGRLDIVLADRGRLREVAAIAERFHQTTSSRYRPVEWLEAEARWLAIRDTVMGKEGDRAE